jgi:tetratricopeptide (TPR) repeat protein
VIVGALTLIVTLTSFRAAHAEHPIDIQRLSAEGDHFKALSLYELLPHRQFDTDTYLSAAKSAWALGLSKQATALFDAVLRGDTLSSEERARVTLSRGIIDFQEERFQEAALFAEKAASLLPEKSPLRGRALLLLGQSLLKVGAYATAEEKLLRSLADSIQSDRPEVVFALGTAQVKLGKLTDAEKSFKAVPTEDARAPMAVRSLASIALQTNQGDRARFWFERGRSSYPEAFLDSWADYGVTKAALEAGDIGHARAVVEKAEKRFPPSDAWLILMRAALEHAEWKGMTEGQRP